LLKPSVTYCLERDRAIVEYAGDLALDQVQVGTLDQDGRKARILSVCISGAEGDDCSA
jgi:hypothetical protein